jgi:hypothetical protein
MSTKTNLWVDAAIFFAFLVAFEPALTGIAIHEWLSLALAAALLVHLVLHWDWVIKVTIQFFRKLFHSSRLNYLVDTILLIAMVVLMLSGILISRSVLAILGIQLLASPAWRFLHSASADITLIMVGLHFALHWKWVVNTCNRYIFRPLKALFTSRLNLPVLQPVPIPLDPKDK